MNKLLRDYCLSLTQNLQSGKTVKFIEKNRSLDSANHPLEGKKWWVQAEDPWQCLASCIEIRNALNHPDGPEHYGTVHVFTEKFQQSNLPIRFNGIFNFRPYGQLRAVKGKNSNYEL